MGKGKWTSQGDKVRRLGQKWRSKTGRMDAFNMEGRDGEVVSCQTLLQGLLKSTVKSDCSE